MGTGSNGINSLMLGLVMMLSIWMLARIRQAGDFLSELTHWAAACPMHLPFSMPLSYLSELREWAAQRPSATQAGPIMKGTCLTEWAHNP